MRNLNISIIALLESHLKNRRNFLQILSSAIVSGHFSADPFVSSKLLLHSLSDADDDDDEAALAFSKALFFHTQNPNIFAWNFMFKAYSRSSSPQESLALYNLMRRRDSPLSHAHMRQEQCFGNPDSHGLAAYVCLELSKRLWSKPLELKSINKVWLWTWTAEICHIECLSEIGSATSLGLLMKKPQ
ncbi:hypothetical protein FEM48_Zijuj07G0151800 [Ziziphus jujuba var. spinosa]|uniref:Pentatricopeptide repeat-containing protein n=1 Tax=Ziziphus jujuba var. spinosa TaxID=714518 RepID=A0A978V5C9_ZIZJJ|nr:hypothetical protein FEM48_Zijuj07G0151800 [Ziziphus jujuba var. spinosa]